MAKSKKKAPVEVAGIEDVALPQVKMVAVDELIPYANNSRTHSDEQVTQLASSIRTFGWTNPILIDGKNNIIAGHGRTMAAKKLKLSRIPAIVVDHLTEAQYRLYVIADNKLALNAGWDDEVLALELSALSMEDIDLTLSGFDDDEIAKMLAGPDDMDSDDGHEFEPPPEVKWSVIVECGDEESQAELLERLIAEGYSCRSVL